MAQPVFTVPLSTPTAETAAVALAAILTGVPIDDALDLLHVACTSPEPRDTLHRAGWLLLCWDALREGGAA